jgi:hypothetical protein
MKKTAALCRRYANPKLSRGRFLETASGQKTPWRVGIRVRTPGWKPRTGSDHITFLAHRGNERCRNEHHCKEAACSGSPGRTGAELDRAYSASSIVALYAKIKRVAAISSESVTDQLARDFLQWLLNAPPDALSEAAVEAELARFMRQAWESGFSAGRQPRREPIQVRTTENRHAGESRPLYRLPCPNCGAYYWEDACPVCAHRAKAQQVSKE